MESQIRWNTGKINSIDTCSDPSFRKMILRVLPCTMLHQKPVLWHGKPIHPNVAFLEEWLTLSFFAVIENPICGSYTKYIQIHSNALNINHPIHRYKSNTFQYWGFYFDIFWLEHMRHTSGMYHVLHMTMSGWWKQRIFCSRKCSRCLMTPCPVSKGREYLDSQMVVSSVLGVPQNWWFTMEHPMKIDKNGWSVPPDQRKAPYLEGMSRTRKRATNGTTKCSTSVFRKIHWNIIVGVLRCSSPKIQMVNIISVDKSPRLWVRGTQPWPMVRDIVGQLESTISYNSRVEAGDSKMTPPTTSIQILLAMYACSPMCVGWYHKFSLSNISLDNMF